jgi:hypothetical protein
MNRLWPAALALLLALTFAPGAASAATSPPQLTTLRSVREMTLLSFNGRALQVCQREWQSWNRVHGVCRDLATATLYDQRFVEGTVVEFVLFDGTHYERVNDQTSWSARPDESFAPDRDLNEAFFLVTERAQLTRLPDASIAGAPAAHYQYWVLDEARNAEAGGQIVYDQFVSAQGYVVQSQARVQGSVPGAGDGELVELRSYSDFNAPIIVGPPQA